MFVNTAKENTVSSIGKTNDDLKSAANHAGEAVREIINSANNEAMHMGDKMKAEIALNPIRSSAIALAAGVVLGALLRR